MRLRNQVAPEPSADSAQSVLVPTVEANAPSDITLTETHSTTTRRTSPSSAESVTCEKTVASPKSPLILPPGIKPYYQEDNIAIILGDCREVLPTLGPIHLVLTDPPYGIAHPTDYRSRGRGNLATCSDYAPVYGDESPFDPSFLLSFECILWGANYYADKLPVSSGWLVWDKERPHDLDQSTAELAWSNVVKGVRVFRHLWNGMMRASEPEPLVHPTQKPIALMKWCLQMRWTPLGTVVDPYMGGGSTLRAAKDLGRRAIGIEIEEKYCEIAAKRLAQKVMDFS